MKITVEELRAKKRRGEKIVMLTSYDYPTAVIEDECGVDVQLIGDSVGTNMLGHRDVTEVTMEDMLHHVRAVARGAKRSFVLGDMPYGSFASEELALANARRMIEAGADGVKIEGESEASLQVRAVAAAGIPVCAHIGYTPQTDGARAAVQGKDLARAMELVMTAQRLEEAGAVMMVLELIPERLAGEITACVSIPTIGIGAGRFCDGQVQVILDIAGLSPRVYRHAKAYGALGREYRRIVAAYAAEVRVGEFPTEEHASRLPDEVYREIDAWCRGHRAGRAGSQAGV